jgi:hypothetical protein
LSANRTLLFSVLYPGLSDAMVADYVSSIRHQTDQGFDWLMVNDHCDGSEKRLFPPSVQWIDLDTTLAFGKIRELGIAFGHEHGYDFIVFSDIDDYYGENRIAASKRCLADNDFVFTELQVVDVQKRLVRDNLVTRLAGEPRPSTVQSILDYNYIGLSHSAVRLDALRDFVIPATIDVVDWWIFSFLLINGRNGCFLPDVDTFYRQSDANYVGVFNPLDQARLQRGIDVKLRHYLSLQDYCRQHGHWRLAEMFQEKWCEMTELNQVIQDADFADGYIRRVNASLAHIYRGWWSEILPLQKWEKL